MNHFRSRKRERNAPSPKVEGLAVSLPWMFRNRSPTRMSLMSLLLLVPILTGLGCSTELSDRLVEATEETRQLTQVLEERIDEGTDGLADLEEGHNLIAGVAERLRVASAEQYPELADTHQMAADAERRTGNALRTFRDLEDIKSMVRGLRQASGEASHLALANQQRSNIGSAALNRPGLPIRPPVTHSLQQQQPLGPPSRPRRHRRRRPSRLQSQLLEKREAAATSDWPEQPKWTGKRKIVHE